MITKNRLYLLLLLIPFVNYGQLFIPKQQKQAAIKQIYALKNSVLIVRLQSYEKTINRLNELGKTEQAAQLKNKQDSVNQELIYAFRKKFTFCPVYFTGSKFSTAIREKKFDQVVFYNDQMQEDTTIHLQSSTFFTAEVTTIESEIDPQNTSGFEALIFKDDQFVQLKKPFPYYTRTFESNTAIYNLEEVVANAQNKLMKFYDAYY